MKERFDISIRLRLKKPGVDWPAAFGPGTAMLLQGVREFHSLNRAAKEMHMAYSKAWKRLKETEEQLGYKLLERNGPKGSELTKEGEETLALFLAMERAAYKAVEDVYDSWEVPEE